MPMAQGSRPQAAAVWERPWPRGEGHGHPACGTFMALESKATDTRGEISELSHVKYSRFLRGFKWDPGAASARGAADVRGGEAPPPDPQTRGLNLSAMSHCNACASLSISMR